MVPYSGRNLSEFTELEPAFQYPHPEVGWAVGTESVTERNWALGPRRGFWIWLQCVFLFSPIIGAAPFKLLAIGDSLSEEYRFEIPFSAPDSNPGVANVKNWVEILHALRPAEFSMGNYEPSAFNYLDYRNAGYEYNYGVPGFKAEKWEQILYDPKPFYQNLDTYTRTELKGDLGAVDAVLIFLGGNDLSLSNGDEKNDEIRFFIDRIRSYVRAMAPTNLPIIIATVPDIGATPSESLSDPEAAAIARARVATLNANIIALGALPNTYIARIDRLTDRIFDQIPFQLNGTHFIYPADPENPPLHLFCKDGFHPGDVGQALIANEILRAINQFKDTAIPLLTNREILSKILGQNPDQPYLDWADGAGGFQENPDGDALPNLVEYVLDTDPLSSDSGFKFSDDGSAAFAPSEIALQFAELSVLQSETLLDDWVPVPNTSIQQLPGGVMKILPTAPKLFYKFRATPKP